MAFDPQIAGFNADEVRAGLTLAMNIGMPVELEEQPVFVFPGGILADGSKRDSAGVPFDWEAGRDRSPDVTVQVPCAIEYVDGAGKLEGFGVVAPSKLVLTLLDVDHAQIEGFSYVVIAGNKYNYRKTAPPLGLVSVGVYQVHVESDDEG